VKFIEIEGGILIVPIVPLKDLFGIDRDARETVYQMIRELQEERRREAPEEK
jgi:hypothetical protein